MRTALSFLAAVLFVACANAQTIADPASDAPESRPALAAGVKLPGSYAEAYSRYRGRPIAAHRSLDSYERRLKARAQKSARSETAR